MPASGSSDRGAVFCHPPSNRLQFVAAPHSAAHESLTSSTACNVTNLLRLAPARFIRVGQPMAKLSFSTFNVPPELLHVADPNAPPSRMPQPVLPAVPVPLASMPALAGVRPPIVTDWWEQLPLSGPREKAILLVEQLEDFRGAQRRMSD